MGRGKHEHPLDGQRDGRSPGPAVAALGLRLSRARLAVPMTVLAALVLTVTAVAPVLAAPADAGAGARLTLAQPEECDEIALNAEGNIVVGELVLAEAQLELLDADVVAVLTLAAAARAAGIGEETLCFDVDIAADAVTVNGDVYFCSVAVEVDAGGNVTVAGIDVDPLLLDAELVNLLRASAAVDDEACLTVTVHDNDVVVRVHVSACGTATLNEDGSVSVDFGGVAIELPAEAIINADNPLEVGAPTATGLSISAELTLETSDLAYLAEIVDFIFCGAPTGGRVVVAKHINPDPGSGPGEPAPGWTFAFAITGGEIVDQSPTTDEDGPAVFDFTTDAGAVITITEERRAGYELVDGACQPISDGGEPLAPIGVWTDISVTFPAQPGLITVCTFLNTPAGPEPTPTLTTAPTTAPTGGQGPATNRPTITLPPTDGRVPRTGTVTNWSSLVLVTLGLAVAGTVLLAASRDRRKR